MGRLVACCVLCMVWIQPVSSAHPFGDRYAAQQLEVDVDHHGLVVTLTIDAPDALLEVEARGSTSPSTAVADALIHGLSVQVDGVSAPLQEVGRDIRTDLVEAHATVIVVSWRTPVDWTVPRTIRVGNANLGNTPGWFRDEVRVRSPAVVTATNLVRFKHGAPQWRHGAWARDEGLRRVDLTVVPSPPLSSLTAWAPRWRGLTEAYERGAWHAWRAGHTDGRTILGVITLCLCLGWAVGLPRTPKRPDAVSLVPLLLALAAPPSMAIAGAALLLCVAACGVRSQLTLLAWVSGLVWLATASGSPWYAVAGLAWLIGVAAGRAGTPSRRTRSIVAVVAAALAASRGSLW